MYRHFLKRIIDFAVAFVLLVVTLPLSFLLMICLLVANKGSVFFTQQRPGRRNELITIIKFKTMRDRFDITGKPLPDAVRLTKFGSFVRSTSLDELPQLVNVLKGDMSLIGPRPLLTSYLPLYNSVQRRRHEIRPGITGWAQINGRNTLDWKTRFELDVWYVNNISFSVDMKILWLTMLKVLKREGISSKTSKTMEPFKGNAQNDGE